MADGQARDLGLAPGMRLRSAFEMMRRRVVGEAARRPAGALLPRWHGTMLLGLLALLGGCAVTAPPGSCSSVAIALDVGHTPRHPGAISSRGDPEYRFNRALTRRIDAELRGAGFTRIIDTNPDEAEIALLERSAVANRAGAGLFLSIHHDSAQPQLLSRWQVDGIERFHTDEIAGFSLFVSQRNGDSDGSLRLARLIGARLRAEGLQPTLHHAAPIPGEGRPLLDAALGIYRFDGLAVLRSTRMPAVLVEAGVIVNRAEELALRGSERQAQIARALTRAVIDWCEAAAPAAAHEPSAAPRVFAAPLR